MNPPTTAGIEDEENIDANDYQVNHRHLRQQQQQQQLEMMVGDNDNGGEETVARHHDLTTTTTVATTVSAVYDEPPDSYAYQMNNDDRQHSQTTNRNTASITGSSSAVVSLRHRYIHRSGTTTACEQEQEHDNNTSNDDEIVVATIELSTLNQIFHAEPHDGNGDKDGIFRHRRQPQQQQRDSDVVGGSGDSNHNDDIVPGEDDVIHATTIQHKLGGVCCGVCCDYRRAVIWSNYILIVGIVLCIITPNQSFQNLILGTSFVNEDEENSYYYNGGEEFLEDDETGNGRRRIYSMLSSSSSSSLMNNIPVEEESLAVVDMIEEIYDQTLSRLSYVYYVTVATSFWSAIGASVFHFWTVLFHTIWIVLGLIPSNGILLSYMYHELRFSVPEYEDIVGDDGSMVRQIILIGSITITLLTIVVYPHVCYLYEMKQGILSRETYWREDVCCLGCCGCGCGK